MSKEKASQHEVVDWEEAHRAAASKRSLNAFIIFINLWASLQGSEKSR
jgi:hypothetical protein